VQVEFHWREKLRDFSTLVTLIGPFAFAEEPAWRLRNREIRWMESAREAFAIFCNYVPAFVLRQ
jgi:hypothetical protein